MDAAAPIPLSPWQPREQPSVFGVEASARRIGHVVWLDERLFEVVGGWITSTPEVEMRERLAVHCHLHAAHAALWRDRLPQATGVDGASMVMSPGDGVETALRLLTDRDDTLSRLIGLHRVVVPRLVAAHTFHRHVTNAVTDAPTVAVLDTVVTDLMQQWREGEMMIETLLQRAAATDASSMLASATAHQVAIEQAIVSTGGLLGPGTLG